MLIEEREDPPPGVLGGRVVVSHAGDVHERGEERARNDAVHEAVPRVRILLDVVGNARRGERLLELCGGSAQAPVARAVAS